MDRFGHNVRADVKKQGYENSDLPILCETCLGENPYVRLIREENGKECKICKNAFTLFRWKPGTKGRYKQTIICHMCAKVKNVCQTCLFDLEYNLPVQVRDKFLENSITLPENETNRNFFLEQIEKSNISKNIYDNINNGHTDLSKLKRKNNSFKRNMAKVCSFWRKNECNRGDECPYLHKEIHLDKSLANQNIKSRYTGDNDILAEKIIQKYNKENTMDQSNINNRICIHGINQSVSNEKIKECLQQFGKIKSIKMIVKDSKMFISYDTYLSAKNAVETYKDGLVINGCNLTITLDEQFKNSNNNNNNITTNYAYSSNNNNNNWTYYNNPMYYNMQNQNLLKNKQNNSQYIQPPPSSFFPPPPTMPAQGSTINGPSQMYPLCTYYGSNFNRVTSDNVPYSSMLPSEAEQRK
ncbi:RNA-binding protein, putative [Hepatocystis sp. ex Piliocolobus tephrosceles]|nr:RNA-binding protein, putative [Hepatocystis sp. ex Piliocolobus tephrosceles]